MTEAEVRCNTRLRGFRVSWIKKVISKTLEHEGKQGCSVSVLLTGDREIRRINKKYLNHDYATDVISFGVDKNLVMNSESKFLGDIVVSVDTAKSVSKRMGILFKEELARYLVHGTLHLLGYEDKPKKKHDKMHARQEELLKKLRSDNVKSTRGSSGRLSQRASNHCIYSSSRNIRSKRERRTEHAATDYV